MKEKDFDQMIDQYLKNTLGNDEKEKFEKWLDYISEEKAFENISKPELKDIGHRIQKNLDRGIKADITAKKNKWLIQSNPVFKIAASALLFGTIILLIVYGIKLIEQKEQFATIQSAKGKIVKVILPDASIVWLKGASSINYPLHFNRKTRGVDLKGEALFEVAKDKLHPFVIHCGSLVTEVLGTSFNIKQQRIKIEVRVLTGRVHLSADNAAPVTIYPLQKAVFQKDKSRLIKNTKPYSSTYFLTAGTEYNMNFHDTPLSEVITRIEKKFNAHIKAKNPSSVPVLITADLTDQSLTNSVNMISESLNTPFIIEN